MSYIGSSATPLPVNFSAVQSQGFNGTGSQTTFTLNRSVGSAASVEVLVNNVQQSPYDGSYNITGGTSLVFSEAPSAGTNNVYVVYRDQALGSLVDTTAYRKAEVDSAVAGKVSKTGDTMTGPLVMPSNSRVGGGGYGALAIGDNASSSDWHIVRDSSEFNIYSGVIGSGVKRFGIDTSGRVTMPYQPACRVGLGTSANYLNAAIKFNNTSGTSYWFNRGNHYNASTGIFTCPVAGVYAVYAMVIHEGVSEGADMADSFFIRVNGENTNYGDRRAQYKSGYTGTSGYFVESSYLLVSVQQGDQLTVSSAKNFNVHGNPKYTTLSVHLVG